MASAAKKHLASAKQLGKKVINYPESSVPVISTKDLTHNIAQNPAQKVPYTLIIAHIIH